MNGNSNFFSNNDLATWRNQTRTLLLISRITNSPQRRICSLPWTKFLFTTSQCSTRKDLCRIRGAHWSIATSCPSFLRAIFSLESQIKRPRNAYCGNPIDIGDFLILKECIQATRSLRCNENIHIIKPDKGSGVVIMNKIDYISKMDFILQDNSKFENLGPSSEFDNTVKIEAHIQRRLLQLKKEGLLPSKIYSRI